MKKYFFIMIITVFLFYGCSDDKKAITDLTTDFGNALSDNNINSLTDLMSEKCDGALRNNNWAGLVAAMREVTDNGSIDFSFSNLLIEVNGDDADASCTVHRTYLGTTVNRTALLKFHFEDKTLLLFGGDWKVREWWFDSTGDDIVEKQFIIK